MFKYITSDRLVRPPTSYQRQFALWDYQLDFVFLQSIRVGTDFPYFGCSVKHFSNLLVCLWLNQFDVRIGLRTRFRQPVDIWLMIFTSILDSLRVRVNAPIETQSSHLRARIRWELSAQCLDNQPKTKVVCSGLRRSPVLFFIVDARIKNRTPWQFKQIQNLFMIDSKFLKSTTAKSRCSIVKSWIPSRPNSDNSSLLTSFGLNMIRDTA